MKRLFLAVALIQLLFALQSMGQGKVTGGETIVSFTGNNVPIVPAGTPAQNFSGLPFINTFIIPIANPTVALRFYITNNTPNACVNSFTAQVWAVSDPSVNTFNGALANWQVIPLQSTTGGLTQALTISIPASGISYFSTTSIAAPKIALQLVNINNGCASTSVEVTATIFQVAVTSPLISANSPFNFGGPGTNVQGIVPQQATAGGVFPVVAGGLQGPSNAGFTTTGLDTFNVTVDGTTFSTFAGSLTAGFAPTPSAINEVAFAFEVSTGDNAQSSVGAPWVCPLNQSQNCNSGGINFFTTSNVIGGQPFVRTYQSANAVVNERTIIVTMAGTATTARQQNRAASPNAFSSNTLAGSAIFVFTECNTSACTVGSVTDTQGNVFKQIASAISSASNDQISAGIALWMSQTLTTAAADTVTATAASGVISNIQIIEVTGITTAPLTYPAISNTTDAVGAELVRLDALAGNQFVCSVQLTTITTLICQGPATTINGVPVRFYVTDFQINTTVAGTGTVIQLKVGTGVNCAANTAFLSNIVYPNTTVGIQSFLGMRTPLIAPLQNEVCVTQAGTTAGTTAVEIHGYLAP